MNWILLITFIFILLFIPSSFGDSECPAIDTSIPAFSIPMQKEKDILENNSVELLCCIFGVSRILWFFKFNSSIEKWELKSTSNTPSSYLFSPNNQSLTVVQPKPHVDSGIYNCTGYESPEKFISNVTILDVESKKEKIFRLEDTSNMENIKFSIDSSKTLYCVVKAYKKAQSNFYWEKLEKTGNISIISGSHLTTDRTNASLIEGYYGYSILQWINVEDNYRIYNFTLDLIRMNSSHEGTYRCYITGRPENLPIKFLFYLEMIRINIHLLSIGIGTILILILILAYIFKFDIKIILQQLIRKFLYQKKYSGKYNFLFIYDFDHDNEYKFVYQIVQEIESRGFSAFFFHRDQTYGKDTVEDIIHAMKNADMAVIWTTPIIWKNSVCSICLQILIDKFKNIKRIYIMKANKKVSLKHCTNKIVLVDTKSCISSKIYFWNREYKKSDKAKYSEIWFWHHFISWLISSLPLKVTPVDCYNSKC